MKNGEPKYLLDTSIQVARLISKGWRSNALDSVWRTVTPVTWIFSFRDFESSVIGALRYLAAAARDIAPISQSEDSALLRLEELVRFIGAERARHEGDRRIQLAGAYAARFLDEYRCFARSPSLSDFIVRIESETANLKVGFFHYPREGRSMRMECLGEMPPLAEGHPVEGGLPGLSADRDDQMKSFMVSPSQLRILGELIQSIATERVRVEDRQLVKAASRLAQEDRLVLANNPRAARRVFSLLGECATVATAAAHCRGLVTIDANQLALARHLRLPVLYYDRQQSTFSEEPSGGEVPGRYVEDT